MKFLSISMIGFWIALISSGCTSFSSTPITRHENDQFTGDSNGVRNWWCAARPFRGVPVRVKVQTHVDVWIDEVYCLEVTGDEVKEPLADSRLLNVRTAPVITEQLVIVDFKRPAAGRLNLKMEFTDEEYFKKITSETKDETITQSADLIATIIKSAKAFSTASEKKQPPTKREWHTRTVAYQRFDISAADYEQQLDAFVNHHLNACHQCSGPPTYDRQTEP